MEKTLSIFDTPTPREESDAEKYTLKEKLFGIKEVYPMWVADMEFDAAPAIKEALKTRVEHGVYGYVMPDQTLFELAHQWVKRRHNVDMPSTHFRASPSIVTSMAAMVEAFCPMGEGVTVLTPVYPPFLEVVKTQDRSLHTVSLQEGLNGFEIDFEALENAFKQSRLFLFCNPHNPVGRVWTQKELIQIATLVHKYNITIVSDDAHADIVRSDQKYVHISSAYETIKDQTITLMGPGKGFNISGLSATLYYAHNKVLLEQLQQVMHKRHIVAGNIMGFTALKAAYGESETWLDDVNAYLDINMAYAYSFIKHDCKPLYAYKSEGTYLLWINCMALNLSDKALKEFFVKECGVGLSLGRSFGDEGRGFMRMNCAVPLKELKKRLEAIKEGLQRL